MYKQILIPSQKNNSIVLPTEWYGKKIAVIAYPIEKKSTGFYQLIQFDADPQLIAKLEINFRRDEKIIRFLTFRMDKYANEYAEKRRKLKSEVKEK